MSTEEQTSRDVETFKRLLRNVESILNRIRNGRDGKYGRNATATWMKLYDHRDALKNLIGESDEVCAALDNDERLAARWNRAERGVSRPSSWRSDR